MHMVAVRAFELILIVGRHVRILGLHAFCLLNKLFCGMALRALLDVRGIEFGRIAFAVAHLASYAASHMTIGAEFVRCAGCGAGEGNRQGGGERK